MHVGEGFHVLVLLHGIRRAWYDGDFAFYGEPARGNLVAQCVDGGRGGSDELRSQGQLELAASHPAHAKCKSQRNACDKANSRKKSPIDHV
jgi:hypothetical protein